MLSELAGAGLLIILRMTFCMNLLVCCHLLARMSVSMMADYTVRAAQTCQIDRFLEDHNNVWITDVLGFYFLCLTVHCFSQKVTPALQVLENLLTDYIFFFPQWFCQGNIFFLFTPSQKNLGKIKLPSGLLNMESFLSFLKGAREHYCNVSIPSLNLLVSSLVVENGIDANLQSPH